MRDSGIRRARPRFGDHLSGRPKNLRSGLQTKLAPGVVRIVMHKSCGGHADEAATKREGKTKMKERRKEGTIDGKKHRTKERHKEREK